MVISEEPTLDKAAKVENSMHPELQKVCHKYKNKWKGENMIRGIGGQWNSKININFFSKLYMPIDLMKRMISFEH